MKILVLLCHDLTMCFLNRVHLTSCQLLCLLGVHPSLSVLPPHLTALLIQLFPEQESTEAT